MDDTAGITVSQMKAKVRRLKNLGLIIIDYLQLMTSGTRIENRVQEISQMTRNLKIMAKELNVPVICLSQLSRAAEQRQGLLHQPQPRTRWAPGQLIAGTRQLPAGAAAGHDPA